jgi:transcriptional regulator with XRE-family HTH domain
MREAQTKGGEAFATRLKALRTDQGLTQKEMAALCGVSPSHYYKLEAGLSRPGGSVVRVLLDRYGVTERWLLHGEGALTEHKPVEVNQSSVPTAARVEPTMHEAAAAIARQVGVAEDDVWPCLLECIMKLRAKGKGIVDAR